MNIDWFKLLYAAFFTPWGTHETGEIDWGARLLLHGPPGSRKTAIMRQLAFVLGIFFYSLKPGAKGQGGFGVTPVPIEVEGGDGKKYMILSFPGPDWVANQRGKPMLVLVDEMNTAPPAIQAPLLGLTQEKEIGSDHLDPRHRVFGATNSVEDAAGGWALKPAIANRLGHIDWPDPEIDDWAEYMIRGASNDTREPVDIDAEEERVLAAWPHAWASATGIITSFVKSKRSIFRDQPKASDTRSGRAWASPRCYDEKTEVLTNRGFVLWPEVTEADRFATLAPDGQMSFIQTEELYVKEYQGKMHHIRGKHVDQLVTPGHKLYVSTGHKSTECGTDFSLQPVECVVDYLSGAASRRIRMRADAEWFGENTQPAQRIGNRNIDWVTWAEFMGWWLTDGHLQRSRKGQALIKITQVDGGNRARIFELMKRVSTTGKVWLCADRVIMDDEVLFKYLHRQGRKHDGNRFVPRDIMDCGPAILQSLLRGAIGGDGWFNKGTTYICVGPNQKLAADLQEASIKAGGAGRVSHRQTRRETRVYTVSVMGRRYSRPMLDRSCFTEEDYDGKVYCCRVEPYHTLLIRRNGHTSWSGNTWEYATRMLATGAVHRLNDDEINTLIGAYVGNKIANELATFRTQKDLPDPADLLEGNVEFKHNPHRLDRTMVVLNSCATLVAPAGAENRSERAKNLWLLLADLLEDVEDLVTPVAGTLFKSGLSGPKEATPVLAAIKPMLLATERM